MTDQRITDEALREAAGVVADLFGRGCAHARMGGALDPIPCGVCEDCTRDWTPEANAILAYALDPLLAEVARLRGVVEAVEALANWLAESAEYASELGVTVAETAFHSAAVETKRALAAVEGLPVPTDSEDPPSMQWDALGMDAMETVARGIVAWVNANGGEARYVTEAQAHSSSSGYVRGPVIAVRVTDGWAHAKPGDTVAIGADYLVREFRVETTPPAPTDGEDQR